MHICFMVLKEALSEIKGRTKPYIEAGMPQSTYTHTIRNIESGAAKWQTIERFMKKFGYEINRVEIWKKIQ